MSDQVTDLRSTVAPLRRRSRVLAASAVVGLVAGATYVMMQPPLLTSTTLVLLPRPRRPTIPTPTWPPRSASP